MFTVHMTLSYLSPNRKQLIVSTVHAASSLVKQIFRNKMISQLYEKVDLLKIAISILLHSLCKIEVLVAQNVVDATTITNVIGICEVDLQDWLKNPDVIGGLQFGRRINNGTFLYAPAEFRVYK